MKRPSRQRTMIKKMPLEIKAEKALREAVAEAIAEHKLRGHPIVVWRDGKVVSVPPERIPAATTGGDKPEWQEPQQLYVKEKSQTYGKIKSQLKK